jgi:cellulose synthase/poly-beta-1,6-N-acetylglucosamine synthase-like glycosyltransferase
MTRRIGLAALAFVLAGATVALVVAGRATLPLDADDGALRVGVGIVLAFLVVLVVRYVLLLWLGFLHHIESHGDVPETGAALPRVTVLVPVFNEELVIVAAMRSLLALDYPAYDVLIVDDGSTDETFALASALQGQYGETSVRVVRKSNGGKASALNVGIAIARTPFVLCMDGDSRLTPGTLRFAMRHFADPRVGAVAGNVKVVNRTNLWTRLQALEYIEGLNLPRRAQGFMRAVNIVPGPLGVFRRDMLVAVGGYDGDTYAEDADLTLKMLTAGWHIVYEPRAIAWTEAPETLHDLIKQRYRWTRGILQALRKRRSWLASPRGGVVVWGSLLAMMFEAIVWPAVNVLGNLFFALAALSAGAPAGILSWWALLTMLDTAAALHSVAMEGEDLALVPYAVIYRFVFITLVDVAKLFATVEQLLDTQMTWGKLERAGRL